MPAHHPLHLRAAMAMVVFAGLAGCSPPPPTPPALPAVYVSQADTGAAAGTRQFSAVLSPRVESELAFRTGGQLLERRVDLGQRVQRGQVLARLDPADLRLAELAATEQLRSASADAVQSASDAARLARLQAEGFMGGAEAERQRARADAAAARQEQARSQLQMARNRLQYSTLHAPFDGVVTAVRAQAGQVVGEGQPVLALARTGELEVAADLPEQLVGTLRQQHAQARLADAADAPALPLTLREVAAAPHPQTRSYPVRFALAAGHTVPPDWQWGRSMTLILDRSQAGPDTFVLPLGAIVHDGQATSVWLVHPADGSLQRHSVQVHAHGADGVQVTGLPPGALVASAGAHKLDAGMRVRPVQRPLHGPAGALQ